MKTISALITKAGTAGTLFLLPIVAAAQVPAPAFDGKGGQLGVTLRNIISFINDYVILFILGIGFLFFVWAMFMYFIKGGANEQDRETGKKYLVYSVAGFVMIFIFWGIVTLLASSSGMAKKTVDPALIPGGPGAAITK